MPAMAAARALAQPSFRLLGASHENVTFLKEISVQTASHGGSSRAGSGGLQVRATLMLDRRLGSRRVALRATTGEQTIVRSVPVQVAKELLDAGHRYLDVRTPEEFAAGHVDGAVNVPYLYRQSNGMTKNDEFVQTIAKLFDKKEEIVVGCHSGVRSLQAVSELLAADYANITDMGGGFRAWLESGLPAAKA